jgi:molybdate transport system ATP-binding protein
VTDHPLDVELHHHLRRIDLDVALSVGRETLALIGTSGAGKTSVLLAIAGLLRPDRGRIVSAGRPLFDSQRRVDMLPEERRVGLVFQSGALFPHLSVAQNVAYGLQPHAENRRERDQRVGEILERFAIAPLASSRPDRISGGERQRVALARAVATSPDVLLLDEPLSALDAVTKSRVAAELSRTLGELRLPTILVSHDLGDVAGLADRVAVMDAGRIVQTGTTSDLLRAPASAFVAAFVGINYFAGEAKRVGGLTEITLDDGACVLSEDAAAGRVAVVIQPWDISLCDPADVHPAGNMVTGLVTGIATRGSSSRVSVATSSSLVADIPAVAGEVQGIEKGALVAATWSHAATRVLPLARGDVGLGAA